MDPLFRVREAEVSKLLPFKIVKQIEKRMKYVEDSVNRVEKASGLSYPSYYVEPILPVASSSLELGEMGVMYARTMPIQVPQGLEILVQLSAPLVLYGLKTTIRAVLAHEFLHYIELVRKLTMLDMVSDTLSSTLYESTYADTGRLYDAKILFKDKPLVKLVEKKFSDGLIDPKLEEKTLKMWMNKGLPSTRLSPDSNVMKLPLSLILSATFDPAVMMKIDELEKSASSRRGYGGRS